MMLRQVLRCGAALVVLVGLLLPGAVYADQRQDWMLTAGRPGTFVNVDVAFGALQAALEQRINIFGGANQLALRASTIAAIPFGGAQVDADLRIVILNLGLSAGAQDLWMNQTFEQGVEPTRKLRRERDASGDFDTQQFGFVEARAGLVLPFNDYFLFNNVNAFRINGADDRTFDPNTGVVHNGDYLRSDFQLFVKHNDFGGFAPLVQVLNFEFDNQRRTQLNFGFTFISRAGLVSRDDFIVFQMLFHAGDLVGYDNSNVYGLPLLRSPAMFTLAYRSVIQL